MESLDAFIDSLPKAELHLHLEGTLEPELAFELAARNGVKLRFPSVEALRQAYSFADLQSFLDVYYRVAAVLVTERDFRDLAAAYVARAAADGVKHAEVFFDPQTHTVRGVSMGTIVRGLQAGLTDAGAAHRVTTRLILCLLRHLPEDEALQTIDEAAPFGDAITAIGLDSSEVGHPPSKFARAFARARALGWHAVAHAGEEGPPAYVWEALEILRAERIDHGVRALEDSALVERLRRGRVPLTVCPLSNVKLRVFDRLEAHNLKGLLDQGLVVTINSDDPAYFGGYVGENYRRVAEALRLSRSEIAQLARNSFAASFLPDAEKRRWMAGIDRLEG